MKVVMIGSGNVATVLGLRIREAGHDLLQVFSRREDHARRLAEELGPGCGAISRWEALERGAELYIVALPDDALQSIGGGKTVPGSAIGGENATGAAGGELRLPGALVVHTAGAVARDVLLPVTDRSGVLYPLQSLRREIRPFPPMPLLVDARTPGDLELLHAFAGTISGQVEQADDVTRLKLHLSAIMVNNFTNYIFLKAAEFCRQEGADFSLLLPLISETADRLSRFSPRDVQTGPAIRGDQSTIDKHLQLLAGHPDLSEMYRWFTMQIGQYYRGVEKPPAI